MEEWDKTAFIAFHAINANPFLKHTVDVVNPYRDPKPQYVKVRLEDVEALR